MMFAKTILSWIVLISCSKSCLGIDPTAIPTAGDATRCNLSSPVGVAMDEILPGIADGRIVLVDVRRPEELAQTGKIPGSYNIPLNEVERAFTHLSDAEFESQYGLQRPPQDTLVFTCRSGRRVVVAWNSIKDDNYCHARVYYGSYLQWKAEGGPLVSV